MKTRLFVYGTLKSDQSNHHRMAGQTFIGKARTTPDYRLFEVEGRFDSLGKYPALVKLPYPDVDGPGVSVEGEIWDVDQDCLAMLNAYEDLDSGEYVIKPISIMEIADSIKVYGYLYNWSVVGMRDSGQTWSL
ncbi:MAG: gamma-glutamylcyclotransferase [Phycisphaeraceae bacterium]|nr:gamma-glutamylcyclotransferase [Phycisphaeraceae bacterium]